MIDATTVGSQPKGMTAVGNDGVDEATDVLVTEVSGIEVALIEPRAGIDDTETCRCAHHHLFSNRRQTFRLTNGQVVSLAIDNAGQRTVDGPYPQPSEVITSQTGNTL